MKKYDSNDLTVAFAIGMILGLGIMVLTIIYWFYTVLATVLIYII